MNRRVWLAHELAALGTKPDAVVAKLLGRSISSVRSKTPRFRFCDGLELAGPSKLQAVGESAAIFSHCSKILIEEFARIL